MARHRYNAGQKSRDTPKNLTNTPFPSCLLPLFQNESKCETFHIKISFSHKSIQMQIKLIFIFPLGLVLKRRQKANSEMAHSSLHQYTIGNLRSDDNDGSENNAQRTNFPSNILLRLYPNSLNLYLAELSGAELKELHPSLDGERKFAGIVLTFFKNFESGHNMSLSCRGRQRNVPKCITNVQAIVLLIKTYCFVTSLLPSSSS